MVKEEDLEKWTVLEERIRIVEGNHSIVFMLA
jgi:hypothetical protein